MIFLQSILVSVYAEDFVDVSYLNENINYYINNKVNSVISDFPQGDLIYSSDEVEVYNHIDSSGSVFWGEIPSDSYTITKSDDSIVYEYYSFKGTAHNSDTDQCYVKFVDNTPENNIVDLDETYYNYSHDMIRQNNLVSIELESKNNHLNKREFYELRDNRLESNIYLNNVENQFVDYYKVTNVDTTDSIDLYNGYLEDNLNSEYFDIYLEKYPEDSTIIISHNHEYYNDESEMINYSPDVIFYNNGQFYK